MSVGHNQLQPYLYAPLPRPSWLDDNRGEELRFPHGFAHFVPPNAFYHYPPNNQPYLHGWVQHAPHVMGADIRFPRVRELGFRLRPHDAPAACISALSFAMEPGVDEREEHEEDEEDEGGEHYASQYVGGHADEHGGGHEGGRVDEYGGEPEDQHMDEDGEEHVGHGGGDAMGTEGEDDVMPRRWRKVRKPRRPYTVTMALRKTNWFESSMEWEDEHFRAVYRVSKDTFWGIVDILKNNRIFQSKGRKSQRPVHYQLGVFLMRYGVVGSHVRHPKLLTSIGEGTVILYCRRVIRAIREYGLECVVWPTAERKEEIKRGFKKLCGLDGVIGSLDGTLCGLETKPRIAGDSYISRKKTLSVNVQAAVDHNGQFIAFQNGWPGSRPDCAVWQDLWVNLERRRLFSPGEFLLADGGYPISPWVLTPFARNELNVDGRRRRQFNYQISRARIVVEWAFGRLKARFPALKKLGAVRDMSDIYRAIEVMMVVHNMCFDLCDASGGFREELEETEDEPGVDLEDVEGEIYEGEGSTNVRRAGQAFRQRCMDIVCR